MWCTDQPVAAGAVPGQGWPLLDPASCCAIQAEPGSPSQYPTAAAQGAQLPCQYIQLIHAPSGVSYLGSSTAYARNGPGLPRFSGVSNNVASWPSSTHAVSPICQTETGCLKPLFTVLTSALSPLIVIMSKRPALAPSTTSKPFFP